ncbi:MAG: sigma-70 family RNA polymerase sigma factor [Pseudomonadota bacterium]|nr:sigma-70 family RNA polymerase sigma factor [Pseudomonadota bacterium]
MTAEANTDPNDIFLSQRPRLFAVAYRMLGAVSDAEDALQEAFLRWQRTETAAVEDPKGFLTKVVTNLCLDQLRSARHKRELYPGEWLPEPIVSEDPVGALDQDVSVALLLALERLTPLERAAFLLREVFDVDYEDVANALDRSQPACRKLVERARQHVETERPRSVVGSEEGKAITVAFFQAARTGDTDSLAKLLAQNVRATSDGGGKVASLRRLIEGQDKVVRFFAGVADLNRGRNTAHWRFCYVNGLPAIISQDQETGLIQTTAVEIEEGKVSQIYIVRNPEKTTHLKSYFQH